MSRGIDPATHRPLNESAAAQNIQEPTTISFASSVNGAKQEDNSNSTTSLFGDSKDNVVKRSTVLERCPDLNLELTISPPHHQNQSDHQPLKSSGERNLCFSCCLGLQNGKDCSCGINGITGSTTGGTSTSGYDFLGLKSGVLDYRSLEMK